MKSRLKQSRLRAFTLLECLVALLVISGSVLVISGLTKLARMDLQQMQDTRTRDWQSFCNQLRAELDGSTLTSCDGQFLYVKKTDDWRFGLPKGATDFRKSHANGEGYQPMLFGVKSCTISRDGQRVTLNFSFQKGEDRCFIYKFPDENTAPSK